MLGFSLGQRKLVSWKPDNDVGVVWVKGSRFHGGQTLMLGLSWGQRS
jgi:hypothetical protein